MKKTDVYYWLLKYGYFPENYILPPCFRVVKQPLKPKIYYKVKKTKKGNQYKPIRTECINVHFPKTDLTDRNFGIINPEIHNDIAFHIASNWEKIVNAIFPENSIVSAYSFPIPIDSKNIGRISYLRSGRMIYEFIGMIDSDIASVAYKYSHLVKADIKSFYPSIYTHSIAWAIHGKQFIRKPNNMYDNNLLGNKLDKLFQNANDGCTNGIPIGPVVSDLVAEIIASSVDVLLTKKIKDAKVDCEIIRFKDDYRILTKSKNDGVTITKFLQASLKEYNLELSDSKTSMHTLPDGLFREWVSKYHIVNPKRKKKYSWKEFRELYLSVISIDKECPGTGVIDRFLSDIVTKEGQLCVSVGSFNLQKVISMLLMLGSLRVKAFPKIIAILETIINSPFGNSNKKTILKYLESFLKKLSLDEERNKYLISWISYFMVSNSFEKIVTFNPKYKDPITRSIFNNRGAIFKSCKDFKLFMGCKKIGKKVSMMQHLDVFNPPEVD
ncbi:RNA-directed DNA polymerase [Bathymodiolus thermophilus thioautotrophic gill symbiont]|uniref:RNA-directed DNA polymerase n=1 Tax=Bathymodiolus thermophilus thioautotrophic gill symbiont TaxID=2360 RepID=UPI001ED96247|nr:RNA-directed DNA polymerase [Bathymodiolus thermophilus thioautotrophic gill symbiont]